jgi:hypothetical protein
MDNNAIGSANLRALFDEENRHKDLLIDEITKSSEILKLFLDRICRENDISPITVYPNKMDQLAKITVNTCQVILSQLKQSTTTNACTNPENAELIKLTDVVRNQQTEILRLNNEIKRLKEAEIVRSKPENASQINVSIETPAIDIEASRSDHEDPILETVRTEGILRLQELIDRYVLLSHLTSREVEEKISDLEGDRKLELIKTSIKAPYGVTYPTLVKTPESAATRILNNINGLTLKELPLLVYAAEEYLPKYGYKLIAYAPAIKINGEEEEHFFIPHLQMQNKEGRIIYLMFEGFNYNDGENTDRYLLDYRRISKDNLYFVALNPKIAKEIKSKMSYLNLMRLGQNLANSQEESKTTDMVSVRITNVADWSVYEDLKKKKPELAPLSIWFIAITKGMKDNEE